MKHVYMLRLVKRQIAKIAEVERLQERRKRYLYRLRLSYGKQRQILKNLRADLVWFKRQQRRQP